MDYQLICSTGTDTSYDLIIDAITPRPEGGVVVEVLDDTQRERAKAIPYSPKSHREASCGLPMVEVERATKA